MAASPRDLVRLQLAEAEALVDRAAALSRDALAVQRWDAVEAAAEAVRTAAHAVFALTDAQRTGADFSEPLARAREASQTATVALGRALRLLGREDTPSLLVDTRTTNEASIGFMPEADRG
jgi:hypothetical protein